jgi:23S rRNA (cytidine1920-2'-O)/16S rRNA (cytidine1409-2'-O)-methyltransferase
MAKTRLDVLLVEKGLAESRAKAQALIMAGQVRVNGQTETKAATAILADATLTVDSGPRYVSRGGEKLEGALEVFPVNPAGRVCVDVGASTGGFSDCLLQRGAAKIYTIDVGKGILHWKIRSNPRVVVMEETNARYVEAIPEPVSLVVVDASFISLKTLLPVIKNWLTEGDVIALIKPQFEAGRQEVARGAGVVRDAAIHRRVLAEVLTFAQGAGFGVRGLIRSPLLGPKGNAEFLVWLQPGGDLGDVEALIVALG